ncbi:MAG: hypothetical protein CHACPFDD_00802 [Phycisphaerae bacterium]|nr:hypothetical protein [Phycisphaerae bacterium]
MRVALAAALVWAGSAPGAARQETATAPARDEGGAALPARPREVTLEVERSIRRGLEYLAAQQNRDGSWRSRGGVGTYPVAMTALSGLALLSSGSTPTQGPYAKNVSAALTFILKSARRDGLIAQLEEEGHCMHGHGFALLFLAECFGMEEDPRRLAEIRLALQRGVALTGASQSAAGGWLYTPNSGGDEGSVTVTQVQALRAARNAGIAVPKKIITDAMKYLENSANPDGGIRYQVSDSGPSRPALAAAAVVCWMNAGEHDNPLCKKALGFVERTLAPNVQNNVRYFGHYFYAHLYMAQAMYLAGDAKWLPYYKSIADTLVNRQEDDGSWDGDQVGPTYGTAVALIILQLPYRNLPIMQR